MDTHDYYLIIQTAEGEKVAEGFAEWVKDLRGDGYTEGYYDGLDDGSEGSYSDGYADGYEDGQFVGSDYDN